MRDFRPAALSVRARAATALWELAYPRTAGVGGIGLVLDKGVRAWLLGAGGAGALALLARGVGAALGSPTPPPPQLLGLYFMWLRAAKPDTAACAGCSGGFGLLRPRHACRLCGEKFCGACLAASRALPGLGLGTKARRVCKGCAADGVALPQGYKIQVPSA